MTRLFHEPLEEIVHSGDADEIGSFFRDMYRLLIDNPTIIGLTRNMVDKNKNDTDPTAWNAEVCNLPNGDNAVLLYMPIENKAISARIVGIILGEHGDGYYYCMLNKDRNIPSVVSSNRVMYGTDNIGEVQGSGALLKNSFLKCIQADYYR